MYSTWLERIAPVKAVGRIHGGQAERPTPLALESVGDARVSEILVLPVEGHTIGMVNNLELDGFSDDILPGTLGVAHASPTTFNTAYGRRTSSARPVDIVVFGRTLYAHGGGAPGRPLREPRKPDAAQEPDEAWRTLRCWSFRPVNAGLTIIDLADYR